MRIVTPAAWVGGKQRVAAARLLAHTASLVHWCINWALNGSLAAGATPYGETAARPSRAGGTPAHLAGSA